MTLNKLKRSAITSKGPDAACDRAFKQGVKMTTKTKIVTFGRDLETQAIRVALSTNDPNSRSPAFALQEIYKIARASGLVDSEWELQKCSQEELDAIYRGYISWNERECHWQKRAGLHMTFEQIVKIAVRWYINNWDFKRHTRDADVQYPEDLALAPLSEELKHMSDVLEPARYELTRRIFKTKDSDCYRYIDVEKNDAGLFVAGAGRFDEDVFSHKRCGPPNTLWNLELKTVFPILRDTQILSYTVHSLLSKRGV